MLHLIKSQKNEVQIIFNDYIYEKKRIYNLKQEWRCIIKRCHSKALSNLNLNDYCNSFTICSNTKCS